jgi:hypothetical protein
MECDRCHHEFKEIIILRKSGFTSASSKTERKYKRVCWSCCRFLSRKGKYNFGIYWSTFFSGSTKFTERLENWS